MVPTTAPGMAERLLPRDPRAPPVPRYSSCLWEAPPPQGNAQPGRWLEVILDTTCPWPLAHSRVSPHRGGSRPWYPMALLVAS